MPTTSPGFDEHTIFDEIRSIAGMYDNIHKIVLFGSRARGDNALKSDIDICVYADGDIFDFEEAVEENINTLLEFDITRMRDDLDNEFLLQIDTEGILIYEKS
ncbi:MAG: nucleotidyltransferase domain-containing protein [Candidatus Ornithomonoglobus sp.]